MKTFEEIQKNDKVIIDIYKEIVIENKGLNINYRLPLILSYVLITLNGVFMIVMILIHIYKLIFMKGE
jgi:cytochrome b subunit of formate dehydrogenase